MSRVKRYWTNSDSSVLYSDDDLLNLYWGMWANGKDNPSQDDFFAYIVDHNGLYYLIDDYDAPGLDDLINHIESCVLNEVDPEEIVTLIAIWEALRRLKQIDSRGVCNA